MLSLDSEPSLRKLACKVVRLAWQSRSDQGQPRRAPSPLLSFPIKVREVNVRGWSALSGEMTALLRLLQKPSRRQLGGCPQTALSCAASGSMPRSGTGTGQIREQEERPRQPAGGQHVHHHLPCPKRVDGKVSWQRATPFRSGIAFHYK